MMEGFQSISQTRSENKIPKILFAFINNISDFKEKFFISKVFHYKDLFSISADDSIKTNTIFKVISSGSIKFNSEKQDPLEIVILHITSETNEKIILKNSNVLKIDSTDKTFFMSR